MQTKTERVRELVRNGELLPALRIAKDFRMLGDHRVTIQQGWAAYTNPSFYRGLRRDPDQMVCTALSALLELYGNPTTRGVPTC